jgi:hypothetical protein
MDRFSGVTLTKKIRHLEKVFCLQRMIETDRNSVAFGLDTLYVPAVRICAASRSLPCACR